MQGITKTLLVLYHCQYIKLQHLYSKALNKVEKDLQAKKYGVAHTQYNTSVGLLCHFPGLNADGSAIRQ